MIIYMALKKLSASSLIKHAIIIMLIMCVSLFSTIILLCMSFNHYTKIVCACVSAERSLAPRFIVIIIKILNC